MTQTIDLTTRRLGQITGLAITGQAAAAELELTDWVRQRDCPSSARVMLAALLARRRAFDEARHVLRDSTHDPLELLTLLSLVTRDSQQTNDAKKLAQRLGAEFAHVPFVRQWLSLIGENVAEPGKTPDIRVEQLAAELLAAPQVIRSLVAAQQYEPTPARIDLLRRAIARIAPEFAGSRRLVPICQALAELAELADDIDEARRWAHRGLKIDPFCAPLAMVLSRIEDDPAVGPPAAVVLDKVAERYPAYPDVRSALIRREHDDGLAEAARRRLADWLANEPQSAHARRLHDELERAA